MPLVFPPDPLVVKLPHAKARKAFDVAVDRQFCNAADGLHDRYSAHALGDQLLLHIAGALVECALASHLSIPWPHKLNDFDAPDVGPYQARGAKLGARITTSQPHLLLHDADSSDDVFVAGYAESATSVVLSGWCYGREGKQKKYWRERVAGRPCYWVPRHKLNDLRSLPSLKVTQ